MQFQWPRAAFKQYQLQKTSIVDLTHAAVPCLPYPPPGEDGHKVARREGVLVPCMVLPTGPLGKREGPCGTAELQTRYSTTEHSRHRLLVGYLCTDQIEKGLYLFSLANKMLLLATAIQLGE